MTYFNVLQDRYTVILTESTQKSGKLIDGDSSSAEYHDLPGVKYPDQVETPDDEIVKLDGDDENGIVDILAPNAVEAIQSISSEGQINDSLQDSANSTFRNIMVTVVIVVILFVVWFVFRTDEQY